MAGMPVYRTPTVADSVCGRLLFNRLRFMADRRSDNMTADEILIRMLHSYIAGAARDPDAIVTPEKFVALYKARVEREADKPLAALFQNDQYLERIQHVQEKD